VHNGGAASGVAHPCYKTGKYSKYLKQLPQQLGDSYQQMLADPQLGALSEELALQSTRIAELLGQLRDHDTPAWTELDAALDALAVARGKEATAAALDHLATLIRTGAASARARDEIWYEVRELCQEKAKVSSAESRRLADLQGTVRVEDALLFARALLNAARDEVKDPEVLRRVQHRCLSLLPRDESGTDYGVLDDGSVSGNGHADRGTEASPTQPPAAPAADGPAAAPAAPTAVPPAPEPDADQPQPQCGLKELPPGADPAEWEYVPDEQ
jgi:hypothetical protein